MGVSPLVLSWIMRSGSRNLASALSLYQNPRVETHARVCTHSWQRKSPAEQAAVRVAREEAEKTKDAVQKIGA